MQNRLKLLRKQVGLTQQEVANVLGVAHSTYQRYEAGEVPFDSETVPILATILRCHPGELFAEIPPTGVNDPAEQAAALIARRMTPENRKNWLSMGAALSRTLGKISQG